MVKVEVLYIEGCPNHLPAVERVKRVLREQGLSASIEEVLVSGTDRAEQLGFIGSPTIRVNGVDVDPETRGVPGFAYSCRAYFENGKPTGLPSPEMIRRAVVEMGPTRGE